MENWINVKDKLPEHNENLLLWLKGDFYDVGYCDYGIDDENIREWWVNSSLSISNDVLFWTALPKPPTI